VDVLDDGLRAEGEGPAEVLQPPAQLQVRTGAARLTIRFAVTPAGYGPFER
jgi:hypothetical protein